MNITSPQNPQQKIIKKRQMLQGHSLQHKIARSLRNLKHESSKLPPHERISSYYYSSQLLHEYALNNSNLSEKQHVYFTQFLHLFDLFVQEDLSMFKVHHRDILGEIRQFVTDGEFHKYNRHKTLTAFTITNHAKHTNNYDFIQGQQNLQSDQPISITLPQSIRKSKISSPTAHPPPLAIITEVISTGSSESVIEQNIEKQQYEKIVEAYKEHRIDEAFELKENYEKKFDFSLSSEQKAFFSTIQLEYQTMINFYREFDQEGWEFDKEENGTSLQYKVFEAQKQIGVRVTAQLDVPIDHFLAILTQIDLFEKYVPFCYGSRQLKSISRNEKIGTSKVFIPCLTDREVYFYAAGYDRIKKNGSIFLFSKTINDDKVYQQKYGFKVPEKTEYVRLQYKFYIIEYIPVSLTKAKIRLAVKVDMKLNYLPQFIINMSARKFAFDYFKNIPKLSRKFEGSEWQKKVKQNPSFYQFFSRKIDEYMKK